MRILYLSADYGIPVLGNKGGAVHARELMNAFRELGHEVVAVTPRAGDGDANRILIDDLLEVSLPDLENEIIRGLKGQNSDEEYADVLFREIRSLMTNPVLYDQIETLHMEKKFDLIYERYSLWNFSGMKAAQVIRVPHLLEVNAPLVVEQETYRSLHLKSLSLGIEEVLFQKADSIIAVSEEVGEYIRGKGAPENRIHVVPNAVDPERFNPDMLADKQEMREKLSLPGDRFIMGFLGSLKKWHGLEVLIAAMQLLLSKSEDVHLLIVGDGPLRRSMEERFDAGGISDRITFTGAVPYERVPSYLKSMDAAVAPYTRLPGFYFSPLKIFEYMAMGKPVVAARIGQIGEIIDDEKTGLLFDPGDSEELAEKIIRLKSDPEMAREIGNGARESVLRKYNWKKNAAQILSVVEELCAKTTEKESVQG